MLGWLRRRRRRRWQSERFPDAWIDILTHNVPFYGRLPTTMQHKVRAWTQVMVAEKHWEGCGGLSLGDEHRVTIAGHAARLTFGFEQEYFDEIDSILVYPSAYEARTQRVVGPGVVIEDRVGRIGEAWYRGPIIVSWSDVIAQGRPPGRNVILHEFAHQLDMRNGRVADGVPVTRTRAEADRWQAVTSRDYARLVEACQQGHRGMLDCYGATSPAEFFAVATEAFFECPVEMAREWPEYFELLSQFYGQRPS